MDVYSIIAGIIGGAFYLLIIYFFYKRDYKKSGAKNWKEYSKIKKIEEDKLKERFLNFFRIFLPSIPSKMNTTQKVLVMIFLISIVSWIIFGINAPEGRFYTGENTWIVKKNPFTQKWYQILLLGVWISSFFGIYLFKD